MARVATRRLLRAVLIAMIASSVLAVAINAIAGRWTESAMAVLVTHVLVNDIWDELDRL